MLFSLMALGCSPKSSKNDSLNICISQAVSLFPENVFNYNVERAWHIVGCMESEGFKIQNRNMNCEGNNRFLAKCYD